MIDPEIVTEPFLIGGMFGSAASGNKIVVFDLCMISFRVMLPWKRKTVFNGDKMGAIRAFARAHV